ncbi:MAG TPA: phosphotransferase [Bacillales bacterium]|nr:phosphotransferase [Bacillales bacterium]
MTYSLKNRAHSLPAGTVIRGKWHHCRYRIIRPLGRGANGDVFLAECVNGRVAVKIGRESLSLMSEVNVLRKFSKVQGNVLGPSLIDVDDWNTGARTFPFYVMEYLKGVPLLSFIQSRPSEWIGILVVQLLADLDRLHRAGWVFGDLKPDNLLVTGPPPRVRWLDVGGTTVIGRSIKEYTEFFDRGYWGLGSRKAEPSYDLFAVAMIMINAAYPKRFNKKKDGYSQLMNAVKSHRSLKPYQRVIAFALQGKYAGAPSMRQDMVKRLHVRETPQPSTGVGAGTKRAQASANKPKKRREWTKTLMLGLTLFIVYFLYLFGIH